MSTASGELTLSWRAAGVDRWLAWRDRLLASPLFQRRAAAFALTRAVARRHARELFDLVAGFVYSQVLLACVRLHLFDILAEGPQPLAPLAVRIGLPAEAAQRLTRRPWRCASSSAAAKAATASVNWARRWWATGQSRR